MCEKWGDDEVKKLVEWIVEIAPEPSDGDDNPEDSDEDVESVEDSDEGDSGILFYLWPLKFYQSSKNLFLKRRHHSQGIALSKGQETILPLPEKKNQVNNQKRSGSVVQAAPLNFRKKINKRFLFFTFNVNYCVA